MPPQVQIPSPQSTLLSIYIVTCWKDENKQKKRTGLAYFLKNIYVIINIFVRNEDIWGFEILNLPFNISRNARRWTWATCGQMWRWLTIIKGDEFESHWFYDAYVIIWPIPDRDQQSVWPEKNRQMSIKVSQKWFQKKNDRFWYLYKNCLR